MDNVPLSIVIWDRHLGTDDLPLVHTSAKDMTEESGVLERKQFEMVRWKGADLVLFKI